MIIPRMIYQLRLSDAGIGKLRKVSKLVKKTFQKILHLPEWTPDCWLHLKAGGGLTNLVSAVIKMRRKVSGKMVNSEDSIAQGVAVELDLRNIELYQRANLPVSTHGVNAKIDAENLTCLSRLTNGTALLTMAGSCTRRDWLWHAKSFSSRDLITSLKILSGTLPTNINRTRGRRNPTEKRCRNCLKVAETDLHVLNKCPINHELISKRHNEVCNKITKEFKRVHQNDIVQRERTWRVGAVPYQPDITIYQGNKVILLEVTIPYENQHSTLIRREHEKESKYQILKNNIIITEDVEVDVVGIAIGSAGTISKQTAGKLRKLKLVTQARALQMITLHYSCLIWFNYITGGGAVPSHSNRQTWRRS